MDRRVEQDGTLVVERVRKKVDAGVYTCTATNKQGRSATGSVRVEVLVPPKISPISVGERVQAGERVTLTCTVSLGDEPLSITWLWHGTPIGSSNTNPGGLSVVNLNSFNSVLSIELVGPQHAGDFTCLATNAAAATRYTYTLTVHGTALGLTFTTHS
ncbi:hypothetical protein Pmani_018885 [Petrolisthes manimaculis]|uniref:Ig-like domain-containing protein n=1 Tax=Petrolisthes manimaculis TaxID=1843537 RepID=A0AAE1U8B0_9EUCA|nr:hypothetical protein Pmani_018885 [Petrolisthes manimaculis]